MTVLILAEHDNQSLQEVTLHALSAAAQLESEMDVVVCGWQCQAVVDSVARLPLVRQVLVADAEVYAHALAENMAALLAELGKNYSHLLATASTYSKNILPRVAALLDVSMIADVVQIDSQESFVRPLFAGNVLASVQSQEKIKVLTVRGTAFPAVTLAAMPLAKIEKIQRVIVNEQASFVEQQLTPRVRPELTSARIVLSGGRGLKSAENFKLLEALADRLGAAVGASRAAVDAGYAPNDYQVGQTGKVVAPDLYIAVGLSGAIQHMAGMKDSKVIVAINNDPEAPMVKAADYAIIGDLFQILAELQKALSPEERA